MPFTFLNLLMLGGAAAFSIPVIIHLFNRSRFRVVPWGAMHLLEPVLRKNRKRVRIEQLILLLLRAMIPVLLALAMARPVMTGWTALAGGAKTALAIVLDDSYSMEAGGMSRSHFAQAREATVAIVRSLPRGSQVHVLRMGGSLRPLSDEPSFNTSRIAEELAKTQPGFGSADVPAALEVITADLAGMDLSKRDLVIASDFQRINWDDDGAALRKELFQGIKQLPVPPSITFLRVGQPVKDNIAVEELSFSRTALGVNQKLRVHATLRNFGQGLYPDLRVYFRVDGQERTVTQISVPPGESQQVLFTHVFDRAGSHVIEVYAEADPLKADNSMMASIPVWDRLPVLLVDGAPSTDPLRGETDFLRIAMQPFMAGNVPLADLIDAKIIEPGLLNDAALAEARVVVLANVPQLAASQVEQLRQYVTQGGSVIIAPGDSANVAWYNAELFADGNGLLPGKLMGLGGDLQDEKAGARIVQQHFDHAALEMFNDPRNGNLSEAQIKLWFHLEEPAVTPGQARDPNQAVTIARLDNGDPFLMEKKLGEGLILQLSVPLDADWSNLPLRPFYLPLTQQLVTYAASKVYPSRNVEVGQTLAAFFPPGGAGKTVTLTDPQARKSDLAMVERATHSVAEYRDTAMPGLYTMDAGEAGGVVYFVVNTSRRESDLDVLTDEQLRAQAQAVGADVARNWEEYRELDRNRRFGREVWKWFFIGVLGLLFGELVLQQWFAKRRL